MGFYYKLVELDILTFYDLRMPSVGFLGMKYTELSAYLVYESFDCILLLILSSYSVSCSFLQSNCLSRAWPLRNEGTVGLLSADMSHA